MVNNILTTCTANNSNHNLQSMVIRNGMTAKVTNTLTGTVQVANQFPASLTTLILKTLCQTMLMIACRMNLMLIGQVKLNRYRLIRCSSGRTRMWANAQPDGRPAEHRWCPLFNAAKFG